MGTVLRAIWGRGGRAGEGVDTGGEAQSKISRYLSLMNMNVCPLSSSSSRGHREMNKCARSSIVCKCLCVCLYVCMCVCVLLALSFTLSFPLLRCLFLFVCVSRSWCLSVSPSLCFSESLCLDRKCTHIRDTIVSSAHL